MEPDDRFKDLKTRFNELITGENDITEKIQSYSYLFPYLLGFVVIFIVILQVKPCTIVNKDKSISYTYAIILSLFYLILIRLGIFLYLFIVNK